MTLKQSGEGYFRQLTHHVCTALGANIAFVGYLTDNNQNIQTASLCLEGKMVSNIKYSLKNTPCAETVSSDFCLYMSMVQTHFPLDKYFKDQNIEAYVGVPLIDDKGVVIGELVGLCRGSITKDNLIIDSISASASRCSSELCHYIDHKKL